MALAAAMRCGAWLSASASSCAAIRSIPCSDSGAGATAGASRIALTMCATSNVSQRWEGSAALERRGFFRSDRTTGKKRGAKKGYPFAEPEGSDHVGHTEESFFFLRPFEELQK
eukprot:scaffold111188_cov62-Phaeocystis_antarctica.AAC.8